MNGTKEILSVRKIGHSHFRDVVQYPRKTEDLKFTATKALKHWQTKSLSSARCHGSNRAPNLDWNFNKDLNGPATATVCGGIIMSRVKPK